MTTKRPPIPVIILFVLLLAFIGYFTWDYYASKNDKTLSASGTIEATRHSISPEIGGKVAEVLADEGDAIKVGQIIFTLDGAVLKAQRVVSAAALESAKSARDTAAANLDAANIQYQIALQTSQKADQTTRIYDWKASKPGEIDQPLWYFSRADQLDVARKQVDAAAAVLKIKTDDLLTLQSKVTSSFFMNAEKELQDARAEFLLAKQVLDTANGAENYTELHDAAKDRYDDAKDRLNDAQDAYDDALTSDEADDILTARAEVRVAQETYDSAVDTVRSLETGSESLSLAAAARAVDQAKAASAQADKTVSQAEANLALLDTQLAQLTITSPVSGIVLTRNVEPGEIITAGYEALSAADLNDLTITVYVPEDRIGRVSLGEKAVVTVDSFPGEKFTGTVIHIGDQAEFTPRNVQTEDGRKNTVFAVKLQLADNSNRLKPGMPADVDFE
jgi:multidrug resistance efflux pump